MPYNKYSGEPACPPFHTAAWKTLITTENTPTAAVRVNTVVRCVSHHVVKDSAFQASCETEMSYGSLYVRLVLFVDSYVVKRTIDMVMVFDFVLYFRGFDVIELCLEVDVMLTDIVEGHLQHTAGIGGRAIEELDMGGDIVHSEFGEATLHITLKDFVIKAALLLGEREEIALAELSDTFLALDRSLAVSDILKDIEKVAAVERHHATDGIETFAAETSLVEKGEEMLAGVRIAPAGSEVIGILEECREFAEKECNKLLNIDEAVAERDFLSPFGIERDAAFG